MESLKYDSDEDFRPIRKHVKSRIDDECWFYISMDLHARKIYDVIKNNSTFRFIRGCSHDDYNFGVTSKKQLEGIAKKIKSKSVDEISSMSVRDFEPHMSRTFECLIQNGETKRLLKKTTEEFGIVTGPALRPWCGDIVEKFIGINCGEQITSDKGVQNVSGFHLLASKNVPEDMVDEMERILTDINYEIENGTTENEDGDQESGMFLSTALNVLRDGICRPMEEMGMTPVIFVLDASCNKGLSVEENCNLAKKNAFGKTRNRKRRNRKSRKN